MKCSSLNLMGFLIFERLLSKLEFRHLLSTLRINMLLVERLVHSDVPTDFVICYLWFVTISLILVCLYCLSSSLLWLNCDGKGTFFLNIRLGIELVALLFCWVISHSLPSFGRNYLYWCVLQVLYSLSLSFCFYFLIEVICCFSDWE